MRTEHRLDLSELDAEASHFHLLVQPAQIFDLSRPVIPRQIARAVKPHARFAAERVRLKTLRRQLRPLQIASSQSLSADQ